MLTTAEKPRATASRIRGRAAIVRSLRGLLLRTHRYGRGRARSREDVAWTARVLDNLLDVLAVAEGDAAKQTGPRLDDNVAGTEPPTNMSASNESL